MKKITLLLVVLFIFSNLTISVLADETSVTVSFDAESGLVTLEGSANGITTIRVIKSNMSEESLSDSNLPIDLHQITSYGVLNYEFYMPEETVGGKYIVTVTDRNGKAEDSFVFVDKNRTDNIISNIVNKAENKKEFVTVVLQNASDLGIDVNDENYSERSIELMYNLCRNYKNSVDFYNVYNFCCAICSMAEKNQNDVEDSLKKHEKTLGIDYTNDYEINVLLTAKVKKEMCLLLSDMDYSKIYEDAEELTGKQSFPAVFEAISALATVRTVESWKALEDTYTNKFSFLNKNIVEKNSHYKSSSASNVYTKLIKKSFSEIIDLKENFDDAVKRAVESAETTTRPSGGGGGTGSSISAPSISNKEQYEELPQQTNAVDDKPSDKTNINIPTFGTERAIFSDVRENDWFYEAVSILAGSKIVSGDSNGSFRPADNITRAEFAKLIVSAFSISGGEAAFSDVAANSWYAPFVSKAAGGGIVNGYEGMFRPNDYITRQDATLILYRVSKLLEIEYTGFEEAEDMNDVSLYAYRAVGTLLKNGVINGMGDGKFMPLLSITRAQAVQLIYNAVNDMSNRV